MRDSTPSLHWEPMRSHAAPHSPSAARSDPGLRGRRCSCHSLTLPCAADAFLKGPPFPAAGTVHLKTHKRGLLLVAQDSICWSHRDLTATAPNELASQGWTDPTSVRQSLPGKALHSRQTPTPPGRGTVPGPGGRLEEIEPKFFPRSVRGGLGCPCQARPADPSALPSGGLAYRLHPG